MLIAIITEAALLVLLLCFLGWREAQFDRERERLLDRIQAPSLVEYKAARNEVQFEPVRMNDEREAELENGFDVPDDYVPDLGE